MTNGFYYWKHPEAYKRLQPNEMKSKEAVVILCEEILRGLKLECDDVINALRVYPTNERLIEEAKKMYRYLVSDEISSMSFGGSITVARDFKKSCPVGVFGE